ncbi:hypothetical protein [Pseudomonas sp. KBW05]|uniref:hypothetical protein n=1 Tax=Pseudomonas sp. KBW05 TaxID=2153360 RepID=UPI000F5B5611|nr:hypothetical protein [Pseudomonas sp. KBW05]RQO57569.1 hypothetical protein DBR46_09035 [Pseudomonas sp. KBW05]
MSRNHRVALEIIDSRFTKLQAGDSSAQLHAETSMAVEMAHSLGAIDTQEHSHYVQRLHRLYEIQAEGFLADIRRAAP